MKLNEAVVGTARLRVTYSILLLGCAFVVYALLAERSDRIGKSSTNLP